MRRAGSGLVVVLATTGCAGGAPLLHPAQTLAAGEVRAVAGLSAHVVPGSLGQDLNRARDALTIADSEPTLERSYAKGALVAAAVGPGLAPVAGARVGIGNRFEGGLTYTGRAVRVDMRHAFERGPWALSLGLGASAVLYGRQQGEALPNVDVSAMHGYGVDLPVLGGWTSQSGVYTIWFGPRAGVEHVTIETLTSEPKDVTIGNAPIHLDATRFFGGGVLGLATGFRHIHVALEAAVSYESVSGTYGGNAATVHGISITPASAMWWTF